MMLDTAIVFLGSGLASFFNLFYHLVSVRLLSAQDYGAFNALVSLILFTSMAISPLRTTLARFFTEYIEKKDFPRFLCVLKKLIRVLTVAAVAFFALFYVLGGPIAFFFKTERSYILLCSCIITVSFYSLVFPAFFQSFQKFKIYSIVAGLSAFGKLVIGGVLMCAGMGISGGLFGFLAGSVLMFLVSLIFLPRFFKRYFSNLSHINAPKVSLMPICRYFFPVSIAMFSFTCLSGADVILVKHFFSQLDAGYYSIAQMVGKIVLFLPSALSIVILPKSISARVNHYSPFGYLKKALLIAGLCSFVIVAVSLLKPVFLLKLLTGNANPVSVSLVWIFAVTMSFYSFVWIIINFFLALHETRFVLPFCLLAILEVVIIYNFHSSLYMVLYSMLFFSILTFSLLMFLIKRIRHA